MTWCAAWVEDVHCTAAQWTLQIKNYQFLEGNYENAAGIMKTQEEKFEYRILCTFMASYFTNYSLFVAYYKVVNGTCNYAPCPLYYQSQTLL